MLRNGENVSFLRDNFFVFGFGWKSFSARALSGGATTMNEKHANNSFFFLFVLFWEE